jgi:radical SAM superfamily enzyme YgiQ (UPF0313 family)
MFLASVGHWRFFHPLVTPPMGLLYLAGYLRTKFDLDIRVLNQRTERISDQELIRRIVEFDPDIVGFGSLTPHAGGLSEQTKAVREVRPNALILLGGPHASAFAERSMDGTAADAAIPGEGELSFEQILQAHLGGEDFSRIPGLIWRDPSGEIIRNAGLPPVVEDLDSLPFPAYDLIDLPKYWKLQSMPPIPRRRYVSLVSSRGCPYQCSWCHNMFGKRFRAHSAERIVEEIARYSRTYGINDVEFLDDIFNLDRKRLHAFCDLVHERNLKIRIAFPNAIRADILTQEDVDALADAGMYFVSFALESGSPRIQKLTGKNLNIPRFLESVEMAAAKGVFTNGFNMLGFPTETAEEMQQTIDVATDSALHTASFFTATPFPNTSLYDSAMASHPDELARICYHDTDFHAAPINLSAEPDHVLFYYRRKANRQFFMKPSRILRILRDFPQPQRLHYYVPIYVNRLCQGLLTRRP